MAKKHNDSELSNISPERQKELSKIPKTKNVFPSKTSAEQKEEAKRYEGILKSGIK